MPANQTFYIARKGKDASFANVSADTLTLAGVSVDTAVLLASGQVVDLNGEADSLILDADQDTTISAPTDDQIDIEISGADDFRFTANTFTALSGSTIATNTIAETTAGSGVTIDGVLVKDGGLVLADAATVEVDTINEATSAAGVTVDGALIKDGNIEAGLVSQELTESGAITITSGVVFLNHATVAVEATLAAPAVGADLWIINSSASGTAAHTVTVPGGVTWDGTNDVATLNAPDESIHVIASSATRWRVVTNNGSVGFS